MTATLTCDCGAPMQRPEYVLYGACSVTCEHAVAAEVPEDATMVVQLLAGDVLGAAISVLLAVGLVALAVGVRRMERNPRSDRRRPPRAPRVDYGRIAELEHELGIAPIGDREHCDRCRPRVYRLRTPMWMPEQQQGPGWPITSQEALYHVMREVGAMSANDIRDLEDMPPVVEVPHRITVDEARRLKARWIAGKDRP